MSSDVPWAASVHLDEHVATELIARAFPSLRGRPVRHLGTGWDNYVVAVGREHVVRIPRREVGDELLRTEARWMPEVAGDLPLPISAIQELAEPGGHYPYAIGRYPLLPGAPATEVPWSRAARVRDAATMGHFFHVLHQRPVSTEALAQAPRDDLGRMDVPRKLRVTHERMEAHRDLVDVDAVLDVIAQALHADPHEGAPVWVHGDVHARQILITDDALIGLIDWGDMHLGDPAIDLAPAFSMLPPEARAAFFEAYGPVSTHALARAKARAIYSAAMLVDYGIRGPDPGMARAGMLGLAFMLEG